MEKDIYVVAAVRTAIGSFGGTLKSMPSLGRVTGGKRRRGDAPTWAVIDPQRTCALADGCISNVRLIRAGAAVPRRSE